MALNVKKREEKRLKSDQMIEDAINQGKVSETSSKVILEGLNNEVDKTNAIKEDSGLSVEQIISNEPSLITKNKVGRKKIHTEESKLIHIRVPLTDRKDIDMAIFARNQSMQEYIMDLIKEDMKKNKDKYINIYNTMNSFREDFN